MRLLQLTFLLLVFSLVFSVVSAGLYNTQEKIDSLNQVYEKANGFYEKQKLLKALSNCYQNEGDWEQYEQVVQQMLLLQEEKTDSFYLAETYNKLGISNCILGKNNEALDYFNKALELNLAQKMHLVAANSYENLGIVYKDMGNYTKAVDCQLKSLELRKVKKSDRIFNNYIKLSVVLELLGDFEKMDFYLDLAKSEMSKRDSITPRNRALFYNQLGDIYNKRGLNDSSIVCYRKVISNSEQIGWKLGVAEGIGNIADIFYQNQLLDSAIFYHKKSLELSQEISNTISITEEYLYLAKLYDEVGKYDSVMYLANHSLRIAEQSDLLQEQSKALKFIADFYSTQQNYEQANVYLKQHYIVKDSISSTDVKSNVAELETRYETKAKAKQIELLRAENEFKNQRIRTGIILIGILLLLIGLILHILQMRKNQSRLKQNDLQQQVLRSQMNPHFIFNVLGSIQNFMLENDTQKAAVYLANFASLTRSTLEYSVSETISLANEVQMLTNYVELESMRDPEKFSYTFELDNTLESDFIHIPPMLIQPFVENAIKHGFQQLKTKGELKIIVVENRDTIEFTIEDNGIGLAKKKKDTEHHQSMAMNIFSERRKLIQQKFKKEFRYEIINRHDVNPDLSGVLIKINLPIIDV